MHRIKRRRWDIGFALVIALYLSVAMMVLVALAKTVGA